MTFDIDANGIVNVSAKDLGTGKAQNIVIKSTSNMSEADIDKAVKEAEQHAAEDKKEKDLIEARNNADSAAYQAEQSLKDIGDKATADEKAKVEAAIADLREKAQGDDLEAIKTATDALNESLYPIAQKMYADAQAAQQQAGQEAPQGGAQDQGAAESDDVEDATYEDVTD